jgi:hypothetical protein
MLEIVSIRDNQLQTNTNMKEERDKEVLETKGSFKRWSPERINRRERLLSALTFVTVLPSLIAPAVYGFSDSQGNNLPHRGYVYGGSLLPWILNERLHGVTDQYFSPIQATLTSGIIGGILETGSYWTGRGLGSLLNFATN